MTEILGSTIDYEIEDLVFYTFYPHKTLPNASQVRNLDKYPNDKSLILKIDELDELFFEEIKGVS